MRLRLKKALIVAVAVLAVVALYAAANEFSFIHNWFVDELSQTRP